METVESDGDPIRLKCTVAQFLGLDEGQEFHFLPVADQTFGYAGGEAYHSPHYELKCPPALSGAGCVTSRTGTAPSTTWSRLTESRSARWRCGAVTRSTPPTASSARWRGIVDPTSARTHVLLAEGHRRGRKQVATIPIGAMKRQDRRERDQFQVKIGIRNIVMPGARMHTTVVIMLTAPRMVPRPATAIPMIHRSPPGPGEWMASVSGV